MKRFAAMLLAILICLAAIPAMAEEAPAEFSLYGKTDTNDGPWSEMYLFKYIEEKFNVSLKITEISSSIWDEKISIAFATDDYPDFFLNGLTTQNLQTYGSQGIIIDLNDYITEETTPNIYKMYSDYPNLKRASMSYDGHLYSISGYDKTNIREYLEARFFVNTKWCENLGIAIPSTLDEFYDYLVAVRDNDADLDGDAGNEIPMEGAYDSDPMSLLTVPLTALGYPLSYGYDNCYVTVSDGKVVFVPAEELFKNALEFMRDCYANGLLDSEYFTQSSDQVDAKLSAGKAGCFMDWAQWLSISDPDLYGEYSGITPLTSEFNETPMWPSYDVKQIGMFAITSKCQNVEKLLEIADWSFTFDAYCMVLGGYELGSKDGVTDGYEIERFDESYGENALTLNYTRDDSYANDSAWREAVVSPGWGSLPLCRVDFTFVESSVTEQSLSAALEAYNPYATVGWPSSVKFSDSENEELSLITVDLESYLDQMVAKFITGEESLDNFDAFAQGLKDRGLDNYLAIYQAAYDRFMAN